MEEDFNLTIQRLKYCMEQHGDKDTDLARKIGVNRATISKWFSGKISSMKTSTLVAIADAYNVNVLWLYGDDIPMEKEDKYHQERRSKISDLLYKVSNEDLDKLLVIVEAFAKQ